ncbi:MAG: type II toxin-antitoxin system RelE/ParE family toxin [Pyrinomonadaceae bacterium]
MKYRWEAGALDDLEEATAFYFREDPALEFRFSACIDKAIEQVKRHPRSWPKVADEVRRYIVNIFPYSLLYSIEQDHILIVAVAHHSREPNYWKDRTE